jgi:hypothetical protein
MEQCKHHDLVSMLSTLTQIRMASLAGGKIHGVAPNADLVLIKTKTAFKGAGLNNPNKHNTNIKYAALEFFTNAMEEDIERKLQQDSRRKFVINMSWGKCHHRNAFALNVINIL